MPPWTILSLLDWTTNHFKKNGIESARLDAELLLAHVLECDRMKLYLQFERVLTEDELAVFKKLIQRRLQGEPIAYLTGEKEFWSMLFQVGPGVLIPRPETEVLVEKVIGAIHESPLRNVGTGRDLSLRVLDIGTGSGILAITLAKEFPQAQIEAWDISEEALIYARKNAERHGVGERIKFLKKDIRGLGNAPQPPLKLRGGEGELWPGLSSRLIQAPANSGNGGKRIDLSPLFNNLHGAFAVKKKILRCFHKIISRTQIVRKKNFQIFVNGCQMPHTLEFVGIFGNNLFGLPIF
ncbi:MAG TPA: peptide chain release factor N(5)-glutamine methyltransferase [Deltaproteobacteria bacterium]|nr:peptide chain release factor N(5)-glutamine methyltransferase [Deltaproteobacteria bacterium]